MLPTKVARKKKLADQKSPTPPPPPAPPQELNGRPLSDLLRSPIVAHVPLQMSLIE